MHSNILIITVFQTDEDRPFQIYHGIAANPNYLHTYTRYNNFFKNSKKKGHNPCTWDVYERYAKIYQPKPQRSINSSKFEKEKCKVAAVQSYNDYRNKNFRSKIDFHIKINKLK